MNLKHGMSRLPEYKVWNMMRSRIMNPSNRKFKDYGGRGLTMHPGWIESFVQFFEHIGERPSSLHSVERINNNKGYEPGNVKWALVAEQNRNQRKNVMITHNGLSMLQCDWAKYLGLKQSTLSRRLARWPLERALTTLNTKPKTSIQTQ